jgi:glucose-6-phosphate 1-dehydrogenase
VPSSSPSSSSTSDAQDAPTVFVLFGATGDLAKRMVLPAFYDLYTRGLLPHRWRLVGNGRGDVAHEDFQAQIRESLAEFASAPEPDAWKGFAAEVRFAGGGFNGDDPGSLLDVFEEARRDLGENVRLVHYLAIPPTAFPEITKAIGSHGLAANSRVVYEKPYGTSSESFTELDDLVHTVFDEEQVYRIDHFLGKEATQNLHMLRFANRLIGDSWSRDGVAEVQIDVPETLGIADRAAFYDGTGAALDMLVTHLFQVAAEVALEPPAEAHGAALQKARESVISAFRPLDPREVVLGQFEGYRQTDGVAGDSTTDTFVAARLWVDTDRWRDVPFLLRTGKRMAAGAQRVSLVFREPHGPVQPGGHPSVLAFDLSGSGAIELQLIVKQPGPDFVPAEASTAVRLDRVQEGAMAPYTSLLHDVLVGDQSLFTSAPGLAAAFRAFAPLQTSVRPAVLPYAQGGWGPAEAETLPGRHGWLRQTDDDAT